MTTSFVKKQSTRGRANLPYGTKPSLGNNQLLISTGIPSLDTYIGGGLAVGTILMIEEDVHNSYSTIVHKLFLAEGVKCKQSIFLAHGDEQPQQFLKEVPCSTDDILDTTANKEKQRKQQENAEDELKIAWRYKNQPVIQKPLSAQFGHYFDLSHTVTEEKLKEINCTCFCPSFSEIATSENKINASYKQLLLQIKTKIEKENLYTANSKTIPPIMRIDLCSLGSPSWCDKLTCGDGDKYDQSLAWFLLALKSLLRRSFASCVISIPTHLFQNEAYIRRIRHCCDVVIRFQTFPDFEENPLSKEYHGFVHVEKLSSLNCINGQNINTADLAFKLKKRKFLIEKFHLPPDISETVSRSQANNSSIKPGTPLCSVSTPVNNLLDF